ncbi:alpha/beta fold hydrolase [Labrys neptuniae]
MSRLLWYTMKKALAVAAVSAAVAALPLPSNAASTGDAAPAIKEGTVDLGAVHVYYLDTGGKGETVLLMHPASASSDAYRKHQIDAFVAAGYRVVAYDRPNYGKTRYDPVASPLKSDATDDLDAFTRRLGLDRFHIVGTGAGGYIGVDYTLSFPQRVRSLVVANAAMDVMDDPEYDAMLKRERPEGFYNMPIEFQELSPSFRTGNPDGVKAWLDNYNSSRVKPRGPGQPEKNVLTLKGLAATKVPLLLISGEADNYAPPPLYRRVAKQLPNAELITIPESAHAAYWEQPDAYNKAVLSFLAKQHAAK